MSTYTQILYHVVFTTKDRQPVIADSRCDDLYRYLNGVIKNNHSRPVWTIGVKNHAHILLSMHPTAALAELLKDVKVASSIWVKENIVFPNIVGWQDGYGAFTYSLRDEPELIAYLKRQDGHHRKVTFEEEYRKLLLGAGVKLDGRYFP
jgi:putative transposase